MNSYIERNEVLKAMDTWDKFGYTHTGEFIRNPKTEDYVPYVHYEDMVKCVSNFPAADVKPVVRGEWEVHRFIPENSNSGVTYTRCSVCGNLPMLNPYSKEEELTNVCPYCGADMRGE